MKQRIKQHLSFFLILLLCAGCGKAPETSGDSSEGESGEQSPAVVSSEDGPERIYRLDKTVSLEIEDPDTDFSKKTVYSGSYGSELYLLASYQFEDGVEPVRWIYIYDLATQETVKLPFSLETPGMENPYIDSMTVTDKDVLTFRLYGTLEGGEESIYLCTTDLTGKPLDEETPLSEDTGYPPDTGRFFAVTDGAPILWEVEDSTDSNLFRYDEKSQVSVPLATVSGILTALCSDGQGGLYYVNSDQLRHLNLDNRKDEMIFRTAEYGIRLASSNWLLCDGDGKLALCSINTDNPVVYLLTDEEETVKREPIRMALLYLNCPLFWRADYWSAQSDTYRIVKEEIDESKLETNLHSEHLQALEPLRTRIMAELVSGKGPELMIVSEDDMHILAEKGALMDMSELIPEEIQEQLLPGVRQIGTVDGEWIGITDSVYYYTLLTSDSLWSGDSWTVSDMLDLVESRDNWGEWMLSYDLKKPTYDHLFKWGFSVSLGDSPFMDVENGISYFNGEEFIRTLEFCKKYGQPSSAAVDDYEDLDRMLQEDESLAHMVYLYSGLHDYSKVIAGHENCHIVGFPGEHGSGNYMYADSFLVVNANAEHIDAIRDYIAYLLDYDIQFGNSNPVRRDAIRDQVGDDPDVYPTPYTWAADLWNGGYGPWPLEDLKPDGTTYLEEFLNFAESCEPKPYCPDAISEIVQEEIGACFAGDRSAKDTADIIHRRVQLYFDERN